MKRILILLAVSLPGLILMAGCSGAGSYPDGDSRYESFAPDGIPFVVADSTWAIDQRGNHRAVVTVAENSGEGVLVELPWRRPDLNPETKKILVTDAEDKEIKDVVVTKLTPEVKYYSSRFLDPEPTISTTFPTSGNIGTLTSRTIWRQNMRPRQVGKKKSLPRRTVSPRLR